MEKINIIKNDVCFIGGSGKKRTEMRSEILLYGLHKHTLSIARINICYANSRQALGMRYSKHSYSLNYHIKFWCNLLPRIAYENIYAFFALLSNKKTIKTSKVLFLSGYSNYIVFTVKIFAFLYQKPILFDAHGSLYYQRIIGTEDYPESSIYAKILFHIDKLCAIYVDKYITLSHSYVQTLSSDFNLKKEKFIPIYVGFYDAHDREDSDIHVKDIDIFLPSNNKLFHGIPETIQLLSLLAKKKTNLKSVLTNSIFYKKRIKKLGLEKNIEITDWLTNITKTEYLKGTKIVFGPMGKSRLNDIDFSTKMNEALAYGKVLVAQNTPSARELLRDGVNAILIDMNDLEGGAQKIIDILEDEEKRKKMEEESLKTYEKYLKPEIVVKELVDYIKKA